MAGSTRKRVASNRGFASMDQEKQREIARKGGQAVSQDRRHMASIGGKGGEVVSRNREHMAAIGRKGGAARSVHYNRPGDDLDGQSGS